MFPRGQRKTLCQVQSALMPGQRWPLLPFRLQMEVSLLKSGWPGNRQAAPVFFIRFPLTRALPGPSQPKLYSLARRQYKLPTAPQSYPLEALSTSCGKDPRTTPFTGHTTILIRTVGFHNNYLQVPTFRCKALLGRLWQPSQVEPGRLFSVQRGRGTLIPASIIRS